MANARLKLARGNGRKRRRSDAESQEELLPEVLMPVPPSNTQNYDQDEPETTTPEVTEDLSMALLDRKNELESRLNELSVGKPLARIEERGYDANGVRLKRCHRDFLLQEMEWMAADFMQERKWRLKTARTFGTSAQSHLAKKESRSARHDKLEEEARRRTAARVGREVKKFWTKIDKIISFKVKLQSDELRKAAMDRQLKNLVAQTERYASALAESFMDQPFEENGGTTEPAEPKSAPVKVEVQEKSDVEMDSDSDFTAEGEEEVDDETTMEEEERLVSSREYSDEIDDLQKDSELSIEELRAKYAVIEVGDGDDDDAQEADEADDSDYANVDEEADDETTIEEEELSTSREDVDDEVARLQEEGELSIEELRARYGKIPELDGEEEEIGGLEYRSADEEDEDEEGEDEYLPPATDELDDETTMEAAEKHEFSRQEVDEEVSLLQQESELSIEALRAKYASLDDADASDASDFDDDDSDFHAQEEEDDETTIADAEASEPRSQRDAADEIAALEAENELSVDELRARYCGRTTDEDEGNEEDGEDPEVDKMELLATSSSYDRPYLLSSRLQLREYQQAGVNWLVGMCEKRINGILADEMGLGKTIQTISLLAYLAAQRGVWGPHLIVVPTSCMVNWEMELKRWCPAFKVLTYFGSAKRRKELRHGWSKPNAFHVCITSYQLVVQDAHCFKRKKWYYLILDEAHNIKNWKSLRWQTLLHFNSQRRLLLTGTPLQNNIMELWALMHFLMPHVFGSRKEFTFWFQNPLSVMVEASTGSDKPAAMIQDQDEAQDNDSQQQQLVAQLHGIIRPFVLRRLKKDVAKQLPGKFEHVVPCRLSKRQRFLYEDFISRSSTRRALQGKGGGGNFMSMMNVLMQLRKVCNHPDLFEPRPIASPLDMAPITLDFPTRCSYLVDWLEPGRHSVPLWPSAMNLVNQELLGRDKWTAHRVRKAVIFDDVSQPLPSDCSVSETVHAKYAKRPDLLRRLVAIASQRHAYWLEKRAQQRASMAVAAALHEPMLGHDCVQACTMPVFISHAMAIHTQREKPRDPTARSDALLDMVPDPHDRIEWMQPIVRKAVCVVPKARARPLLLHHVGGGVSSDRADPGKLSRQRRLDGFVETQLVPVASRCVAAFHDAFKRTQLFFPDKRLLQFDCGKLQQLDLLLRELKRGKHRCLIFTQMSSMLNILEAFLNLHGHTYFRLDGATKVEKRQYLMEKFNHDDRVFCFILSTRSGGLGINLTGADAVIFYDSDWNPAMDAQAQDRAHRIGQTRDVHIYRLVSEHTVEENILKKAQQKRHLDFLVMAKGQFTTDFFSKSSLRELMGDGRGGEQLQDEGEQLRDEEEEEGEEDVSLDVIHKTMAQLEDEDDVVAMRGATEEFLSEQREFDEETGGGGGGEKRRVSTAGTEASGASTPLEEEFKEGEDDAASVEEGEREVKPAGVSAPPSVTSHDDSRLSVEEDEEEGGGEQDDAEEEEEEDDDEDMEESDDSISDEDDVPRKRKPATSRPPKRPRSVSSGAAPTKRRKLTTAKDDATSAITSAQQALKKQERLKEKARELEDERKLQAWKDSVSSLQHFEDSLNSVDRYALHFREDVDPLYAYVPSAEAYALAEQAEAKTLVNIEEIEAQKIVEEQQWIADGELIAGVTGIEELTPEQVAVHRQLYKRERAHVQSSRRQRILTGENWQLQTCALTGQPFYFNVDTGDATWDKPEAWTKNEQLRHARTAGFGGLPPSVLLLVLRHLAAYPDRFQCQLVCRAWREAALHPGLCLRVNASDVNQWRQGERSYLAELLGSIPRGETLLFASGVYEITHKLEISTPIRLLAAPDAHVELQMTTPQAQLEWTARGGLLCGFHVSRRHSSSSSSQSAAAVHWQHLVHVANGGSLRAVLNDFDGNYQGNACLAVSGSASSLLVLQHNRIFHAGSGSGVLLLQGGLVMQRNSVFQNAHAGVTVWAGNAVLRRNQIVGNKRFGIRLLYHANNVVIEENKMEGHACGNVDAENSGRRFVVRWNETNKHEDDALEPGRPHFHGAVKLLTAKIEERVLHAAEEPPVQPSKAVAAPPVVVAAPPVVVAAPLPVAAPVFMKAPTLLAPAASMGTTAAMVAAAAAAADGGAVLVKRKRKPKTERVLVHGVTLLFRDTCEKKSEKKVKKPRCVSTDGAKASQPASASETSGAVVADAKDEPVTSEAPSSSPSGDVAVLSTERPHVLPPATELGAPGLQAPPVSTALALEAPSSVVVAEAKSEDF